jgi:hypothetical protein
VSAGRSEGGCAKGSARDGRSGSRGAMGKHGRTTDANAAGIMRRSTLGLGEVHAAAAAAHTAQQGATGGGGSTIGAISCMECSQTAGWTDAGGPFGLFEHLARDTC